MPHITEHNGHMIQASKWGDAWEATSTGSDLRTMEPTAEDAIDSMKEILNETGS